MPQKNLYKVTVFNNQKDLSLTKKSAEALVTEFLELEQVVTDEVVVHFVTSETICQLHEEFFQDPSLTDCISFPIDAHDSKGLMRHVLGEVFVCPYTALTYCEKHPLAHPYEETSLYLVHGLLHLLGFDDQTPKDKRAMRAAEKRVMANLAKKDLLLKPSRPRN